MYRCASKRLPTCVHISIDHYHVSNARDIGAGPADPVIAGPIISA